MQQNICFVSVYRKLIYQKEFDAVYEKFYSLLGNKYFLYNIIKETTEPDGKKIKC